MSLAAIYFPHAVSYMARKVNFTKLLQSSLLIAYDLDINHVFEYHKSIGVFHFLLLF